MHKSSVPGGLGGEILYCDTHYLCVFNQEHALCHPSGTYNVQTAPRFLEIFLDL